MNQKLRKLAVRADGSLLGLLPVWREEGKCPQLIDTSTQNGPFPCVPTMNTF